MRSAILISAVLICNKLTTMGGEICSKDEATFIAWVILISIVVDAVEFIHKVSK